MDPDSDPEHWLYVAYFLQFSPCDVFVGYHEDAPASICLVYQDNALEKAKTIFLRCATPDAISRYPYLECIFSACLLSFLDDKLSISLYFPQQFYKALCFNTALFVNLVIKRPISYSRAVSLNLPEINIFCLSLENYNNLQLQYGLASSAV